MILLSDEDGIGGGKVGKTPKGWNGISGMKVWRNLYGSTSALWPSQRRSLDVLTLSAQLESFELPMHIPCLSDPARPFNAIFIRAPAVHSLGPPQEDEPPVQVLATLPEDLCPPAPPNDDRLGSHNPDDLGKVMLRQGRNMVTSFHPELSGDTRVHQYWVESCVLGR